MKSVGLDNQKFAQITQELRAFPVRPDITIAEVPAPSRLAPHAFALTAEATDTEDDTYSGRFVILHDPDGVDEWGGSFRTVIFFRAILEPDLLNDDLVRRVAWSWVEDSTSGLHITELGGTVTTNFGESFGSLSDRPAEGFVEVRASWTPIQSPISPSNLPNQRNLASEGVTFDEPIDSLSSHLQAWIGCIELAGGLTPLSDGVTPVTAARRRG